MASTAYVEHGWLRIPFDGADTDRCYMAIGDPEPGEDDWRPAYKSRRDGRRVLQMRIPEDADTGGHRVVWSRINGYTERVTVVRL